MQYKRKPEWIRVRIGDIAHLNKVTGLITQYNLTTVCEEANCPNRLECFGKKTATFMLLGKVCTRHCKFCNVTAGTTEVVDANEPKNVAKAVKELDLKYAVITSVTRDDLEDQGAMQFVNTIKEIRLLMQDIFIEILTPDFNGDYDLIKLVVDSNPDVYNHNVETIERLYDTVRPEADYEQSLKVLAAVKSLNPKMITKSGIMLGLGEKEDEVIKTLKDLRSVGCDIVTIGQYLQPSPKHIEMVEYIHPDQFKVYEEIATSLGFMAVASSPLVRSSYNALEMYENLDL